MFKFSILIFMVVCSSVFCDSDFELPNTIEPTNYVLVLKFPSNLSDRSYDGDVGIDFKALANVSEIKLHSYGHEFGEILIIDDQGSFKTATIEKENDHVVRVNITGELEENKSYLLFMEFTGNVALTADGLFQSEFENENEEIEFQIATNFNSFKAHHAFPCYDDSSYRTTFKLAIIHNPELTSLSNMKGSQSPATNNPGMIQTDFMETQPISPSSLAFIVSGLAEKSTTSIIENKVAIRKSQIENAEFFLNATSDLLPIVESLMNFNLDYDTFHHIMLMDESGSDIESFYRFNFYREHLILYNPALSPQTKEFSIHRVITAGLVSQFLGSIVSFASHNDAWIFNGIIKFLEYYITAQANNGDTFRWQEVQFISDLFTDAVTSSEKVTERAACIFNMIYNVIGEDAFTATLQRLIRENAYKSISSDVFYEILQESYEEHNVNASHGDLRKMIEEFMDYQHQLIVTVVSHNNILYIIKPNITMLLNFITSNSSDVTDIFWIEEANESQVIESHDWILFNVNRFGCYRVNYDAANWASLTRALNESRETFNDQTISQLIDDSLNLARDGLLSYKVAFDLLELIEHETSFTVWSAAVKNLIELNNRISGLDFHQHFREFVHKISNNYVNEIGFDDPSSDELMMNKFSRLQMIDLACQTGSSACLDAMHDRLVSYLNDGGELPVNLEASILCYGLMASVEEENGSENFNKVLNMLHASKDTEKRLRIIGSLGCYADVVELLSYLNSTLEDNDMVRASEYIHVMRSVYTRSNEGIEAVMMFIDEHSEEIKEKTRDENIIWNVLEEIAGEIFNDVLYGKLLNLLHSLDYDDESIIKLLTLTVQNLSWRKSQIVDDIRVWFFGEPITEPSTENSSSTTEETTESTTDLTTTTTTDDAGHFSSSFTLILFAITMTILNNLQ